MNSKFLRALLLVLLLMVIWAPPPTAQADTQAGIPIFFAETGHTLGYSFRQFYDLQGGLPIFGLPITEVFIEDGRPVQYFERARFEWHADIASVQAGHLGYWAAQSQAHLPAFAPLSAPPANSAMFFPETGHTLNGAFYNFWVLNGGLPTFGYPLSEPFEEVNPQDGNVYMVQYFERARFELHTDANGNALVLLGHLGRQYLAQYPAPNWAVQPVSSASQAWDAVRPSHIRIPRIGVDVGIEMAGFSYGEWEVPRWNAAHYWPVTGYPSTNGNIILAGHVGYSDIIFSYLPNATAGDEIFLTVAGTERRYVIDEVLLLLPSDTWVMNPTSTETLTLITCYPVGVYSHRLIVRASPVQ